MIIELYREQRVATFPKVDADGYRSTEWPTRFNLAPCLVSIALGLLGWNAVHAGPTARIHVAPDGNDVWSGTQPVKNPNTTDGPVATLKRALAIRRQASDKKAIITLAAGRYSLAEPWVFTPDDSGVHIEGASGPLRSRVSGGIPIVNWKEVGNGLWKAVLPDALKNANLRHLSVNGNMRLPTRLPETGFFTITGLAGANPKGKYNTPADRFEFAPKQLRGDWKNLTDIEAVVLHFWVDGHFKIKSIDDSKNLVTLDRFSKRRFTDDYQNRYARFYLSNVADAFTSEPRFYHDRADGSVLYHPSIQEDLKKSEIIAPVLTHLVRFEGDAERGHPIRNIRIERIDFEDAVWEPAPNDAADGQSVSDASGAIAMRGAHGCSIEGCAIRNVGGYGVEILDGCRENRIVRNVISATGAGGIRMTGGTAGSPLPRRTGANQITDNHLHHLGNIFHSGAGILSMHADNNVISHNHIHHLYYTAISVGWVWGYGPSVSEGNRIEFNYIHDVGQQVLSDMGGIYLLGKAPGTVVRGNVLHDIDAWTYGGWGIYTDEGSSNVLIEDNLVYRTKTGAFHQHYGKDNIVRNNIFALARLAQVERSRMEPHLSFRFERNLVYYREGELLGKSWRDDKFVLESNLYWNASGKPVVFPGGLKLEQWQARGFDKGSIVADPRFVDADSGNFNLKGDSPVAKIGFVPFNWRKAGVRK